MDISFCIVSYNSAEIIKKCLDALLTSDFQGLKIEVIVADNGSSDQSVEILTQEFPEVFIIQNDENLGYTKAMNLCIKKATGKYVVQLNPDTISLKDTFIKLFQWMETNPDIGICTPKILNRDGTLQKQCRRSFAKPWDVLTYFLHLDRVFPKSKLFGRYLLTYRSNDEIFDVDAVSGSCMFIRSKVFTDVGLLDERFFAYQEDADFCFRTKQKGWRTVFYPYAEIFHWGGLGGSRHRPYRAIYEWHKSYFLYYQKNLAKDYFFIINWFMYFAMLIKLIFSMIGAAIAKDKIVGTKKPM
ncbi:MAG: hypothetical protein CL609_06865 [Anaerolineaceae bacterium]|nr:hypothetical protein [Anaerolineaceae bacterium]